MQEPRELATEGAPNDFPTLLTVFPKGRHFYRRHRECGGTHQGALRALAFKWVRILHRCWQSNTLYDESRYLKPLRARNAPLVTAPTPAN